MIPDNAIEPQRTPVPTASPLVRKESLGIFRFGEMDVWSKVSRTFAFLASFAVKFVEGEE